MRSWPIQNKEDLDKTKGNLTEWVEIVFLDTFLLTFVASLDFLKSLSFYKNKKINCNSQYCQGFQIWISFYTPEQCCLHFLNFQKKRVINSPHLYCNNFSLVV